MALMIVSTICNDAGSAVAICVASGPQCRLRETDEGDPANMRVDLADATATSTVVAPIAFLL